MFACNELRMCGVWYVYRKPHFNRSLSHVPIKRCDSRYAMVSCVWRVTVVDKILSVLENIANLDRKQECAVFWPVDFQKINELLIEQTAEFENVFLRYIEREQLLQIKILINSNIFSNIDLFEIRVVSSDCRL